MLSSVLQSDMENIRCTMEELDTAAFQTAVDIILEARNIYIVGIRSCAPLAEFFKLLPEYDPGNIVQLKTTSLSEVF